jgi:radical SAM protein with 4Fe4S-binding SPASM domain
MRDDAAMVAQDNPYTRILAKIARQHRLLSVHWELTYRCNATCTHCYLDVLPANSFARNELTTTEAKQLLDQIAVLGALYVTFSGGEIFLRRDFFEIAERARRQHLAICLMTNGILINSQIADRIVALHPTTVELSLYGADAETHEAITRHPRSFERTLGAFQLLHERGIRTVMKTPLMRENVRQLESLRALATRVGATFRCDPTLTIKDNGDASSLKHRLTYDDLVEWLRAEINATDFTCPPAPGDEHRPCSIGLSSMVIDPYGNVFPCVQTRLCAGTVRSQSLQEIWDTSPVFRDLSTLTWSTLPTCRTCELKPMCSRCHGVAHAECGDLRAPSAVNCREALARRQVMIEKGMLAPDFPIPLHLIDNMLVCTRARNLPVCPT